MGKEKEFRSYEELLEYLAKLVGVFGVFLAFSFLYGYFYQVFFFEKFDSEWLISLYAVDEIIAVGVPWTLCIAVAALLFYLAFPALENLRKGIQLVLVIASLLGCMILLIRKNLGGEVGGGHSYWVLEFAFYAVCAGGALPVALRKYREKHGLANVAVEFMIGVVMLCVFIPFMMAGSKAMDIRLFFSESPLFKLDGKVNGVLLGNAKEKYIVLSCDDFRTITLYEYSGSNSIVPRSSVEECVPIIKSYK